MNIDFKIGDIITAYHRGYWRVTKIERRFRTDVEEKWGLGKAGEEYSPLVYYNLVMDGSFNEPKNKKNVRSNVCDALYCKKVTKEDLLEQLKQFELNIHKLINLL